MSAPAEEGRKVERRHPTPDRQPWDVTLEQTGEKRLAKFVKALVVTDSTMTCSLRIYETPSWDYKGSVQFRVHVPIGREDEFESVSGERLEKMPRIQVGMEVHGYEYKGPRS